MKKIKSNSVDNKLLKYIKSYDILEINSENNGIEANGGMSVIYSKDSSFEVLINNKIYEIKQNEIYLINSHENEIYFTSKNSVEFIYISFDTCGAAFFFSSYLIELYDEIVNISNDTILLNTLMSKDDLSNKLDLYFKNSFKAVKMPFNILSIINVLKNNKGVYDIDEINTLCNVPRKIFDKIFRLNVGMSLKTLSKIMKSQKP